MKPLSARQVAERTGLSVRSVQRHAQLGIIPTVAKMDGTTGAFLFDADAIDEWMSTKSEVSA